MPIRIFILAGLSLAALFLAAAIPAAPVAAHHSYSAFDRKKTVTIEGVLEKVRWKNPHVSLTLRTKDSQIYEIFWRSPGRLARSKAEKGVLKVGDMVSVSASPNRDPEVHSMTLVTEVIRKADGWRWWRPEKGKPQVDYVAPADDSSRDFEKESSLAP